MGLCNISNDCFYPRPRAGGDFAFLGPILMQRRDIAGRVNARLEAAYVAARELIQNHRSEVEKLANLLSVTSTLERPELAEAVRKI